MQIVEKKYSIILTVLVLFVLVIGAEEEGDKKETDIDNRAIHITVTAEKRPKAVVMTAGEVSVVGLDEIEASQAQDLEDILKDQVGIETFGGPRSIGQRPNIRGLSGNRVLVTIDSARLNFDSAHKGVAFFEPDWIARAEIIRGPGSALYGSSALGGVLNLRTIEPGDFLDEDEVAGVRLRLGYQNVNEEWKISPTFFANTETDNLGNFEYLLSYTLRDSDDIDLANGDTLDFSSEDNDNFLGKLIWRPSEADKLTLSAMRFDSDQEVPLNPTSVTTTPSALAERDTTQTLFSLNYKHNSLDHEWLNFDGTLYYSEMDLNEIRFSDNREEDTQYTTHGIELHNSSFFDMDEHGLTLTYGYEYFEDEQEGERNGGTSLFFPDAESEQHAFFVQGELAFADELFTIIPGARYDSWDLETNTEDADESELSPKIAVILKLDDELNLAEGDYVIVEANYSEGFRAPDFQELFVSGAHFFGATFASNPNLDPETSENKEVATRMKFGDIQFKGTYFKNETEDFIDTVVTGNFPFLVFTPMNIEEAEIDGIELEAKWQATEELSFLANYTRIRGDNEITNEPLTSIAPDRITLGGDYLILDWGLTFSTRVRIVDDQDRVPDGTMTNANYTVVDLLASWQAPDPEWGWIKDFRFDLGIDNVGNEKYETALTGVPEAAINPKLTITYTKTW